jgi:hypothetical protein
MPTGFWWSWFGVRLGWLDRLVSRIPFHRWNGIYRTQYTILNSQTFCSTYTVTYRDSTWNRLFFVFNGFHRWNRFRIQFHRWNRFLFPWVRLHDEFGIPAIFTALGSMNDGEIFLVD